MKTIIAISVISMLALGISILPTGVYAQADAYSKGLKDAACDAVSCNGHGYDPTCPGDHSSEYCNNYRDGYAAGWRASNANSNGQQERMNPPPPFSQAPSQDQSQSQSQSQRSTNNNINNPSVNNNNNNPTIIIVPPK
jgi:hypothetical protein